MARSVASLAAFVVLAAGCAGNGTAVKTGTVADAAAADSVAAAVPADARTLLEIERSAAAAYAEGRDAQAADLYLSLTRAAPAEASYWYRLANTLVRTSRYDDAAIAYRQALSREPTNARAWHNLGIVRMRQAQEAFSEGVKRSAKGDEVQQDSLRLSTSLYSLTTHGEVDAPAPAAAPTVPSPPRAAGTAPTR